jgi:hypothetical protein
MDEVKAPEEVLAEEMLRLSNRITRLEVAMSAVGGLVTMTGQVVESAVRVAAGTLGKLGSIGVNSLGPWIERTKKAVEEINNSFDHIEEDDDDEPVEVAPI